MNHSGLIIITWKEDASNQTYGNTNCENTAGHTGIRETIGPENIPNHSQTIERKLTLAICWVKI